MQLSRVAVVLVLLGSVSSAFADGEISLRGAYYKERSTRVEQPMIDALFDVGPSMTVDGHFLVDSITSASAATGAGGNQFSEKRYEGGGDVTDKILRNLKLGAEIKRSVESDYFSTWVAAHAEQAFADQNTVVRVLVGHSFDDITNGVAVESAGLGTPHIEESLDTTLISATATQLLSPRVLVHLTYDLSLLDGFQSNLYRVVRGGASPVSERVPDERARHAVAAGVRWFAPSKTTVIFDYRLYVDDWGVVAHTPEVRLIQSFLDGGLDLRVRFRYYTQTAASFYKDVYSQADLSDPSVYVTADTKLSSFQTETLGGQISVALGSIGYRGPLPATRLDLIVEHIWQNNAFGDAWVAELGLTVPFSY